MVREDGIIKVHFYTPPSEEENTYVEVEYLPIGKGRRFVFVGVFQKNYYIKLTPNVDFEEIPRSHYPRVLELYMKGLGKTVSLSQSHLETVVENVKPLLDNKTREVLRILSPRQVVRKDYEKIDHPLQPEPTYDGDKVAVYSFHVSVVREISYTPPSVTFSVQIVHYTRYSFRVKTYDELETALREFTVNYMNEIVRSCLPPLYRSLEGVKEKIEGKVRNVLSGEVADDILPKAVGWNVELYPATVESPYIHSSYYEVNSPEGREVNPLYYLSFRFILPKYFTPPLEEKWEKSKGNLDEMINTVRFIMAFGKDFLPPERAEEFLEFLSELEKK